ncbi:MAG TPA: hypothetical protein PKA82_16860 [Pyrinomonadaceae bacterium]|nr:hypothetical protein [Pyrinomonadaceae bacterium]
MKTEVSNQNNDVGKQGLSKSRADTAYHFEFGFRKEAAIFDGDMPIAPNLYPAGFELRNWMLRKGTLTFHPHNWRGREGSLTNPFSYNSSVLVLALSDIINDANSFTERIDFYGAEEAEIGFIRYYTEFVMYSSRLLEALIKQMLFCTTFNEDDYKGATLGSLIERNCSNCKPFPDLKHKITFLGSLAHRYGYCRGYENCLDSHMNIVRKRRNLEAAHSSTVEFLERSIDESKELMAAQLESLGNELLHMLQHIGDIETSMFKEMTHYINGGIDTPSFVRNFEIRESKT